MPFLGAEEALNDKGLAHIIQYLALINYHLAAVRLLAHLSTLRDELECAS